MASPLAPTIFSTGPQDKLITQDVYAVTGSNPINVPPSNATSALSSLLSSLLGGSNAALGNIVTQGAGSISLNPTALIARVTQAITQSGGSLSQLTPGMQASVLSQSGLSTNANPQLSATVGTSVGNLNTSNLTDANAIIGLVNTLTGNSQLASVIDVAASTAIMSVVMQSAISAGVPGAVQALVANSSSSVVVAGALKANAAYAIQQSDMATVSTIVATIGAGQVSGLVPNSAQMFLSSYKFPANTTTSQYAALYATLLANMNAIQPGWDTVMRDGVAVPTLAPFTKISADATTLLKSQNAYTTQILLAPLYPSNDIVKAAKAEYPYMLVLPTTTTQITTTALPNAA